MKDEIILYRPDERAEPIEVRIEDETVWLSQQQMATLFKQTKQNISLHINNCFREGELFKEATVKESLTVQKEGKRTVRRAIECYNLDVIISVGYRVKSKEGTQFRMWATRVLKDYLLKGFAINNRMSRLEDNFEHLKNRVEQIDLHLNTHRIPTQGVFFDGQVFDAYELASRIIRSATKRIVLIDNYIDESTLFHLAKRSPGISVLLLTKSINKTLLLDVQKFDAQYGKTEIRPFSESHDRFLIIDDGEVYHLGASLKDLGKKWFAFTKLEPSTVERIIARIKDLG